MSYGFDQRCCGTCIYWNGKRSFRNLSGIDFDLNDKGSCGKPGAVSGQFAACRGDCGSWRGVG